MLYIDRETNNHRRNFALRGGSRRMSPVGYSRRFRALPGTSGQLPTTDSQNPMSGSASAWSEVPSGPDVPGEAAVRPEVTQPGRRGGTRDWQDRAQTHRYCTAIARSDTNGCYEFEPACSFRFSSMALDCRQSARPGLQRKCSSSGCSIVLVELGIAIKARSP